MNQPSNEQFINRLIYFVRGQLTFFSVRCLPHDSQISKQYFGLIPQKKQEPQAQSKPPLLTTICTIMMPSRSTFTIPSQPSPNHLTNLLLPMYNFINHVPEIMPAAAKSTMFGLCTNPDKQDKDTNHEQNDEDIYEEPEYEGDLFEIDQKSLPYIFRYNYSALQKLRMSDSPAIPKLAHDIFTFFQDKLIVRRYSEGGKYPNRMKYEEKVKFLMRAFDHRKNSTTPDPERRKQKFNRQKQIEFFSRPQVRQYFLVQTDLALKRKQIENERRIKDLQDCIEMALTLYQQEPERAIRIFDQKIKRKQLPWTDNMFADMEDFSKQIYYRFTRINEENEREDARGFEEKPECRPYNPEDDEDLQEIDDYQDAVKLEKRSQTAS